MTVRDVIAYLSTIAPPAYQESYDNAGLITGDPGWEVRGVLVTLDCTEPIVDEAVAEGANLIVAHHPILFRGIKRLTGATYVERTLIKAIRNDIAIYAIHTNLDNVLGGVNSKIAEKIGLVNTRILLPRKDTLAKLVTFVPRENAEAVLSALHDAGAGQIGNYKNCSFRVAGQGAFMPVEGANPHIGEKDRLEIVDETRVEVIFPAWQEGQILDALRKSHPYEEVAYYVTALMNENQEVGSGLIGEVPEPEEPMAFLQRLKVSMDLPMIRHTRIPGRKISKIAVCGGAGSFLLSRAIQAGADAFISADFKYHEFFDAENRILVADIGHYESEIHTKELLAELLRKKFHTFASNFSKTVTNPISYL
jgi:dinuclear metal center YbgI/SA1388 family protein